MAVVVRNLTCAKDTNSRFKTGSTGANGKDQHLIIGLNKADHYVYRAWLDFNMNWTGVAEIVRADLVVKTDSQGHATFGQKPEVRAQRLTANFTEGTAGESIWTDAYQNPGRTATGQSLQVFPRTEATDVRIDVTSIVEAWAPTTVRTRTGAQGGHQTSYGIFLSGRSETDDEMLTEICSADHSAPTARPYIELTYEQANVAPNAPDTLTPQGNVPNATLFTGHFSDPNGSSTLGRSHIQLFADGGTIALWDAQFEASSTEQAADAFSVPIPALVMSGTPYDWRAQVADTDGRWSLWSAIVSFTRTNNAPTCSLPLSAMGSFASLTGVRFRGNFVDSDTGDYLAGFRIQLRGTTADGSPLWDGDDNLWDTGDLTPTSTERALSQFGRTYGGTPLDAGSYSWRARVVDPWGAVSVWAYGTITLSAAWSPDPGDIDFLTQYGTKRSPARVVIRGLDAQRGPVDPPLAVIEDAANIGASAYLNTAGEFYMTLPATHPQVAVIEPYQVHYAVELWRGDRYVPRFSGLVTDFDATEDDVIFYGTDYLGLLALDLDERYEKTKPDKSFSDGGSKYSDIAISTIIVDQLTDARAQVDSLVEFIALGPMDTFPERATIYSTFAQRLPFLSGLIDSHRQGTGKRSRLQVRQTASGSYEFRLDDDPGVDRMNLRLEYGGLVQGFRVTAFGDFAARVHGIGRPRNGVNLFYKSASAPGVSTAVYGRVAKVNLYPDIYDENDLQRRVAQAAASAGRIGKRVALGLRVDAVQPFDGWDIGDSVPVLIQRGVVDTTRYGDGMWSILGVEWALNVRGDSETTLVVLPKEDGSAADPDLIPTSPILFGNEWVIHTTDPTPDDEGRLWVNSTTGHIFQRDPVTGAWIDQTELLDGRPRILGDQTVDQTDLEEPVPGGHNVILNSGFELGGYTLAGVTHTWDLLADFNASRVGADTNITTGAGLLTLTGSAY